MKKLKSIFVLVTFMVTQIAVAQNTVVKTDTINGNILEMKMDKKVGDLMDNLSNNCKRSSSPTSRPNNEIASERDNSTPIVTTPRVVVPSKAKSTADVCREHPKLMGYKIQVAVFNNNDEANKMKLAVRQKFPYLRVETDALLRPNYKVLAGSYFTKESGSSDLKKLRAAFGSAVLIPYRIFCVEAR